MFGVENMNIALQAWYITWNTVLQMTGNQPGCNPPFSPSLTHCLLR